MHIALGFIAFLLACLGCASQSPVLLSGRTLEDAPICLDNRANIPAIVRNFFETRDLTTEEGKIDYLIDRVRNAKLTFIRNRIEYNGPQSAEFLRWKLNRMKTRYQMEIKTAQDFVSKITSGSRMSGKPYAVILQGGSRHNLHSVLQNELDALEYCLKQYPSETQEKNIHAESSTLPSSAAQ